MLNTTPPFNFEAPALLMAFQLNREYNGGYLPLAIILTLVAVRRRVYRAED
jgi:hypothetical protein